MGSCLLEFLRSGNRKRLFLAAGAAFMVPAAAVLLFALYLNLTLSPVKAPPYTKVREAYGSSDAILRDRHGTVIHEMRVDMASRSLDWIPLKDISPALVASVVRSEDRRFLSHCGVDVRALASASLGNLFSREKRGASTITMQLASLIERKLKPESRRRTWREKVRQMRGALAMEKSWSKQEIIEGYLNLVGFRGELRGIAAASRGLFSKEPSGLNLSESVILAALIRSPNADPERVAIRASRLAAGLGPVYPGQEEIRVRALEALMRPYTLKARAALAPHVASYLLSDKKKEVSSTIDGPLQALSLSLLKEQLAILARQNVTDGAVIVVENRTGEIRAYVGNGGPDHSSAHWVDGIRARRQAGSTLKPFLYALALDRQLLTAASLIEDSPVEVPTARGIYRPENYDNTFKGLVSARVALASSLNVPAVKVLMLTGTDDFTAKLEDLGFGDLREGDYYGFSLALGTLDVNLLELTNAYRALANNGRTGGLTFVPGAGNPKGSRAFSPEASFIVSSILSDREARSLTFGYENALAMPFWAAAKTGTSKDMRDNWCIGYSRDFTVGVWIGNFSGASMWNVSGVSGAAPIWHDLMTYLERHAPKKGSPSPPANLVQRSVPGARDPGRAEWFIKGTEPLRLEAKAAAPKPAILYPPKGLIIAIDPDIPPARQKVFFEAAPSDKQVSWLLNNEALCKGDLCPWSPKAGAYTLKLMDDGDRVLDQVSFTVKE